MPELLIALGTVLGIQAIPGFLRKQQALLITTFALAAVPSYFAASYLFQSAYRYLAAIPAEHPQVQRFIDAQHAYSMYFGQFGLILLITLSFGYTAWTVWYSVSRRLRNRFHHWRISLE